MLDRELRFLHVNEALAKFHGISAEDLTGRLAQEVIPNLRENFAAVSKCAREENAPFLNFEFGLKSASAPFRLRHFLAQLYPLEITNGNAYAGLAMVEITERKLAEETLRRSEARYRDVVEHSVYGACIVTSEGAATGTNAAMLRDVRCGTVTSEVSRTANHFHQWLFTGPRRAHCESSPELRICRSPTAPQVWDGWFAKCWTPETSPRTRSAEPSANLPGSTESRERSRQVAADATLRRASAAGT